MIAFTLLAGVAQGLLLCLVGWQMFAAPLMGELAAADAAAQQRWLLAGAAVVLALSGMGLVAATFHLGRPMRAWRAASQWRTSWLSREVIVLPAFMAVVAFWGWFTAQQAADAAISHQMRAVGSVAGFLALLLFLCTAMIYASVKAMRAWASPLTLVNFSLIGLASGTLLAAALAVVVGAGGVYGLVSGLAAHALVFVLAAAVTRGTTLWRNLNQPPKTTLQTAIGIRHPRIRQISQGAMGGSFNTREFFHGRGEAFTRGVRWAAALLGFVLPALVLGWANYTHSWTAGILVGAFLVQALGLLAERWSFFAEAEHTQNLYYQTVS